MKRLLVLAAILGVSVSGAYACSYSKSAAAKQMTLASAEEAAKPATPVDTTLTGSISAPAAETPAE